jgi:hypothetical protein
LVPAITPWMGRGVIGRWRHRMSIGADLARARRQAGMSTAEVSQQTRIRETIIQAIERDDFSICGADFYARGHIRAIAHAIGIDATPLVQEYDARRDASPAGTARRGTSPASTARRNTSMASTASRDASPDGAAAGVPGPSGPAQPGERRKRNGAIALLVLLVAALSLVIYHAEASHRPGRATAADHKPAAAHHAGHKHHGPAPTGAHHGTRHMVISLRAVSEPCWAELTTRGGGTIFQGIIGVGTSKTWTVRPPGILRLGNPGAVTLRIDGRRRTGLGSNPVTLKLRSGQRASHANAS